MKKTIYQKHIIDLLFPLSLFFVFTLSALLLLFLTANSYAHSNTENRKGYTARTALSYIAEKVHQNDVYGKIYLEQFDEVDTLAMEQTIDGENYITYIYLYDGYIRELFTKAGIDNLPLSAGTPILEVGDFTMTEVKTGLLRFTCGTDNDHAITYYVEIKSIS